MHSVKNLHRCKKILLHTNTPKSAKAISNETKIPIASVYRNLHKLQKHKLLLTSGTQTKTSKCKLFQSKYPSNLVEKKLRQVFTDMN